MKLSWKHAFATALLTPIGINILVQVPSFGLAYGDGGDWLGFFGNYAGSVVGGLITYVALVKSFDHDQKLKEDESKENNRKVRRSIQLAVLNRLSQMKGIIDGALKNKTVDDLVPFLPEEIGFDEGILIRNIDDDLFLADLHLIFLKVGMLKTKYYDENGEKKEGIDQILFRERARNISVDLGTLHDRLLGKYYEEARKTMSNEAP